MDRQNLIQRLVARKLQTADNRKAFCFGFCWPGAAANGKALRDVVAQPKK